MQLRPDNPIALLVKSGSNALGARLMSGLQIARSVSSAGASPSCDTICQSVNIEDVMNGQNQEADPLKVNPYHSPA